LIVRLSYIQKNTSEPLISIVSQKFGVRLNIIFADVEIVQGAPIGGTVAIISGEREQITQAVQFLTEKHVVVEVLKDGGFTQ
jgi:D-methionine transport system ATP-binding protein